MAQAVTLMMAHGIPSMGELRLSVTYTISSVEALEWRRRLMERFSQEGSDGSGARRTFKSQRGSDAPPGRVGIAGRGELRAADLTRLIHLLLVEEIDRRLALSDLGRQRYQLLPKASDMGDLADADAFVDVLKRSLRPDER
jgi:hypothetical protein